MKQQLSIAKLHFFMHQQKKRKFLHYTHQEVVIIIQYMKVIFKIQNNFDEAIPYLEAAIKLAKNDNGILIDCMRLYADCYFKTVF